MGKVVVIGGGITGLAAAWELQQQGLDYIVLEGSERLGGKILTERAEGFIMEGAADSFLATKPYGWQLCREIGLGDQLIPTLPPARPVSVLRGGRLQPMPRGMRLLVPTDSEGLLESQLLSEEGKRRMLAEEQIPPRQEQGDESLASFVERRFGREALLVFGEPLLAGIYSGDPNTLSMAASFPNYLQMEQKYGSLIAGTRQAPPPPTLPDQPTGAFVSLKNGLYQLIEGLAAALTGEIRLNTPVAAIEADRTVRLANGETIQAEAVILTTGANLAGQLLDGLLPAVAGELQQLKTVSTATVWLGYRTEELPAPLDSYGWIVASDEPTPLRACTWSSAKIAGRAPAGYSLLRVFIGGHRSANDVGRPDEELVALARRELARIQHIEAEPVINRVFRWYAGSTQYAVGHQERVARYQAACPPWLRLAGSPYQGVGIPDCVRQGREAVGQLLVASPR